jgi:hypothetical protein
MSKDNKNENNQTIKPILNNEKITPKERVYGQPLDTNITTITNNNTTIYMPVKIKEKTPIVLFIPGWGSQDHNSYKTLLSFIATQGYITIYSKCSAEYSADKFIRNFIDTLSSNDIVDIIDKTKIGIVGHSSGGGFTFRLLNYFTKNGYGENGSFIFTMDPWFSFEMSEENFEEIPQETKVIIQHYAKNSTTDPRIPLTIFNQLSQINREDIDFQNYNNLTHNYPVGSKSPDQMQVILKPLDALMENTFLQKEEAQEVALQIGTDNPKELYFEELRPSNTYTYQCYEGNQNLLDILDEYEIDYCDID